MFCVTYIFIPKQSTRRWYLFWRSFTYCRQPHEKVLNEEREKKNENVANSSLCFLAFLRTREAEEEEEGRRERERENNKKDGFFSSAIRITFSSSIRKRESIVHSRSVRHVQQQQ